MDTTVPRVTERRVHVAPLGHEHDRIVEPLRRHGADVVYLLADAPDREGDRGAVDFAAADADDPADTRVDLDGLTDYQHDAWADAAAFADVRALPVALADVYDVLGVTTTVAARHGASTADGDRLFANVSTGPRIAAVGVAIACMIVGARPYSVEPETHYHDVDEGPLTAGVAETVDLPIYPMDAPTRDQVAVLGRLHDRTDENLTTDKWNLIEWARQRDLAFLREAGESRTAKYRALETHVLSPLRDRGYVELEDVGRSDTVRLTETGRRVYFAFQHKLDET
ncbi:DUF6293 family protein [Halorubrum laminariae]|uniref:DUF6293 family protein n=1 Tax=Halorubrum laminariae TaxID=1433523 RepID=A0ABD6BZY6_9EURY|nr:DUF6293 family protein [Halorubrum laminariae]